MWLPWSDSTVARRIYARCDVENKHDGYAPPWRPALTPPSWIGLRDQKFESGFLHRRVCEPSVPLGGLANQPPPPRRLARSSSLSDGLPLIGRLPGVTGAYVATGHSVSAILNASATGEAIVELIVDGSGGGTP